MEEMKGFVLVLGLGYLIIRIGQRLFHLLTGRVQHNFDFSPRRVMTLWLSARGISIKEHETISADGVRLKFLLIGTGRKVVYLANGVGTDLFMWFPLLKALWKESNETFYRDVSIAAPSYRGLFGSTLIEDDHIVQKRTRSRSRSKRVTSANTASITNPESDMVAISIANCASDILQIQAYMRATGKLEAKESFDSIIGWSMGAQTALHALSKAPTLAKNVILLNPTTGDNLEYAFQPFVPLPKFLRSNIVKPLANMLISTLRPCCYNKVWDVLGAFARSSVFRVLLEVGSFVGGNVPEQGAYFHEYMIDTFQSRAHTAALLDLLLALNASCSYEETHLPHRCVLMSGLGDFMTGVYHANTLQKNMKGCFKHQIFKSASHFLLLEHPQDAALLIMEAMQLEAMKKKV